MSSSPGSGARSPRILIVRLSAIGDVIHVMPVLCALRERYPQALLAWAVEERAATLLRGHEALDQLISLPRGWLKSPRTVWRLRRRLRGLRPDLTIDVQGLTKSALVGWLSGARRRIGFAGYWGRELSTWFNSERVEPTAPHAVDRNLQLLLPLGIESPVVRFQVPEEAWEREAAQRTIHQAGLEGGFGMINVGAGWPSKLWPPDRYAAVARHLGRTWNLPTMVVWAGLEEHAAAEEVCAGSDGHSQPAPPTNLRELASLARCARLFIGSDTGPLHMAVAVGTPCVGLYGPWPAERHGPYGPQHVAVQRMAFEGSTRQRRHASSKFMEAIDVESVCEACDRILGRDATNSAA